MSDLTKKVTYKKDEKADSCDNAGNIYVIHDEFWRERNPKLQDAIEDQQQSINLSVCLCVSHML